MMDKIDEVTDKRMEALEEIEKDKKRVARAYNKKVMAKSFQAPFGCRHWRAWNCIELNTKSSIVLK
jgi:hypothetical protein